MESASRGNVVWWQVAGVFCCAAALLFALAFLIFDQRVQEDRKIAALTYSVELAEAIGDLRVTGQKLTTAGVESLAKSGRVAYRQGLGNIRQDLSVTLNRVAGLTGRIEVLLREGRSSQETQPTHVNELAVSKGVLSQVLASLERAETTPVRRARLKLLGPARKGMEENASSLQAEAKILVSGAMESLEARSRWNGGLISLSMFMLIVLVAIPISVRFRHLFREAVEGRRSSEAAYAELLRAKSELQQRQSEMYEALEEAQSQTQLFEHASNRFQQLFGGLPVGCVTYDRTGLIQEWNQAMTDLVGLESYVGCYQPMSFVFRGETLESPIDDIIREVVEDGRQKSFEWTHRLLDGGTVYAMYITYPLRNVKGEILGGIVAGFNITERKLAEQALAESEERFNIAVNASSTGIFDWNIKAGTQHWSPRVYEIFLLGSDFVPGPNAISDRVHPEDLDRMLETLENHLQGKTESYDAEFRVQRGDGKWIWIHLRGVAILDESGQPHRMAGSIDDIDQRKKADIALAESEARFRDVTAAAGEFVFELDPEGRFLLITDRITEITGYTPEEHIGRRFSEFMGPSLRSLGQLKVITLIRKRQKIQDITVEVTSKLGQRHWLRVTCAPFYGAAGQFYGYRGTGLDITSQRQAETALAEAHKMLHDTLESIRDSFYSLDEEFHFDYVNSAAAETFGYKAESLAGKVVWEACSPAISGQLKARFEAALNRRAEQAFELLDPGLGCWYQYRVYPRAKGISVFYQDITDRKSFESQIEAQMLEINEKNMILQIQQRNLEDANRRLATLATTDGLTGLKNHKAFQSSLADLFEEAQSTGEPLSLILLDVDHFKRYNDAFGHPAGDEVLRHVAIVLKNLGRRGDVVARYGGEEFVVILPGARAREAEKAAERIRKGIAEHPWPHAPITASLGVASWEGEEVTRMELVDRADSALYRSKHEGRNKVTLWKKTHVLRAA